ncbi:aspartate/glutamate racemase family protein [Vibrio lentus]|uniref:Aspartate/glutamate racemase n=1 Tax=Vibrio lentus TaxID=136468 RepID=A0AB36XG76_9VIBR|nr:aspartate/glutamate racemase family protein [Vibrio lentus]MCC4837334.1 aspartate/glutamate racemase family protein [Vibrio lentus]PMI13865.1 aspartate/glutamate racemase [Vibrio lentus]PMK33885.1 aspartate/glutamate racemase [Vibrio lentus]PMK39716.1 aspartate/glutamate racemase [Vibrio lentus]PML35295.1 aspartate/glutamate racemase [Vibrio lentus]
MKTIGLLGGMSWESTVSYYKSINEGVKATLGGLNSAKVCMYSVNFDEIEKLQHQGRWEETADILSDAALSVEKGGADFILICTNTMHKVVPEIEEKITIPILHIADTTAQKLLEQGVKKVGLLGTAFTMEQDFYKGRLTNKFGIDVVVPDESDRKQVHNIIYQELCRGEVREESRAVYRQIIEKLSQQGAEAVILGCTEIALLIQQQHTDVPLFDTTAIHAEAAVRLAISD